MNVNSMKKDFRHATSISANAGHETIQELLLLSLMLCDSE